VGYFQSETGNPVTEAVRRNDQSGLVIAIAGGVDVNMRGYRGRTALHYAAALKQSTIVSMLLSAGAFPSPADDDGFTPLHRAVQHRSVEIVEALVRAGADPFKLAHDGSTPISRAESSGDPRMLTLLWRARH